MNGLLTKDMYFEYARLSSLNLTTPFNYSKITKQMYSNKTGFLKLRTKNLINAIQHNQCLKFHTKRNTFNSLQQPKTTTKVATKTREQTIESPDIKLRTMKNISNGGNHGQQFEQMGTHKPYVLCHHSCDILS